MTSPDPYRKVRRTMLTFVVVAIVVLVIAGAVLAAAYVDQILESMGS